MRLLQRMAVCTLLLSALLVAIAGSAQSGAASHPATATATATVESREEPQQSQPSDMISKDGNGITVGKAKVFDDRSLQAMLNDVLGALQQNQKQFIDTNALAANINAFQGGQASTSSIGLAVSTLPTPTIQNTTTATQTTTGPSVTSTETTGSAPSTVTNNNSGSTVTTSSSTQSSTQGPVTATTVSFPQTSTQSAAFTFTPTFGLSSSDLLARQTELTYEVTNLRLLLQRALSDKALINHDGNKKTFDKRMQVVLGFQISVDSLAAHRGDVAEAIVHIRPKRENGSPSLVSQMPAERTYNVVTIAKGARALSLGGIVQALNIGATVQSTKETLYLVKDSDTTALERPAKSGEIEFAWQFRPVLDQRAVTPGMRQVFAVLSLPAGVEQTWDGEVQVKTRWRRYSKRTRTVANAYTESEIVDEMRDLHLDSSNDEARAVAPVITNITWDEASPGNVFVTLTGRFPHNLRIAAGDYVASNSSGIVMATEERVTFIVPTAKLFLGADVNVLDEFGVGAPAIYEQARAESGFEDVHCFISPAGTDQTLVEVFMEPSLDLDQHRPLFRIGQQIFGLGDASVALDPREMTDADRRLFDRVCMKPHFAGTQTLVARFKVPTASLANARSIQIIDPFWGDNFVRNTSISKKNDDQDIAVIASAAKVLAVTRKDVTLGIVGDHLNQVKSVRVGSKTLKPADLQTHPTLIVAMIDREELRGTRNIVVTSMEPNAADIVLPFPIADLNRPRILHQAPVQAGDSGNSIRLDGADLGLIQEVWCDNEKLTIEHDQHHPWTTIYISSPSQKLTAKAGVRDLTIVDVDGVLSSYALQIDDSGGTANTATTANTANTAKVKK